MVKVASPRTSSRLPALPKSTGPDDWAGLEQPLLQAIEERLVGRFHERSLYHPARSGERRGGAPQRASSSNRGVRRCWIAGVDSYLTAATLAAYQNATGQASGATARMASIPAAARRRYYAACASEEPQLLCLGLGFGVEKATVESARACRRGRMASPRR
ncbi:hypothetical protein ACPA9J_15225 [Pseudomonas aeruginosa]